MEVRGRKWAIEDSAMPGATSTGHVLRGFCPPALQELGKPESICAHNGLDTLMEVDMRFALALMTVLCAFSLAHAETPEEWVRKADTAYRSGDFESSADAYGSAIEAGAKNPITFYNGACSSALAGRTDEALERLDAAVDRGFRDLALLRSDSDLLSLHADPRWDNVLEACEAAIARFEASIPEPELRRELLEMRRVDQAARRGEAIPENEGKSMSDVDTANTRRMKQIVEEHGWPTNELVGEDGARSAWLLVQHTDLDPAFQRECLDMMNALEPGLVSPVDLVYLTDRVLVNEGKPQIYGTQFWSPDGTARPRPIQDPSRVESLRAEVGMISMQEYHQRMTGRDWDPEEHR
jgi:hypothetical protein